VAQSASTGFNFLVQDEALPLEQEVQEVFTTTDQSANMEFYADGAIHEDGDMRPLIASFCHPNQLHNAMGVAPNGSRSYH
jgi:hypothetical protein